MLQITQQEERDQLKIVQAVKGWLMNHTRWLLLLDNADDLKLVQNFMLPAGRGHTLLTTRADSTGRLAQRIEVAPLDLEPGALLLLRRADRLGPDATLEQAEASERVVALEITQELGGLPLALDQAGAYIEETRCGLTDYLQLYRSQRTGLLKARGGLVPDHPDAVATTWSMAFQQVERDQPAAIELMRLCAFLAPDAIPEELIVEGASHLGPVLQPVAADRGRLNEALAALLRYSLLRRDPTTRTLIIHRLVQAVDDELDEETQRLWSERVVRAVTQVFPFDEPAPWPRSQRYLAHALACEALIKQWDLTLDEAAEVLNNAGLYLRNRGQYREAEPLIRDALAIGEKGYGHDHPSTYYLLNNLAAFYSDQGKHEEAEPLYQRALAIREKVLGSEHPLTQKVVRNYAILLRKMGRESEATQLEARFSSSP